MKRISLQLMVVLLVLLTSFRGWAQNSQNDPAMDSLKRAMEMREELHRRLRDHLFHGLGSQDDVFKDMDKLFNDVMQDMHSMNDLSAFGGAKNYDMAWTESKDGRTLLLSPHNQGQALEINVEKDMITIKGKQEHKAGNSTSVSSFTHSYSVPADCDGSKVKMLQKEGKILMSFPYKVGVKKLPSLRKKEERMPVAPSKDDVSI